MYFLVELVQDEVKKSVRKRRVAFIFPSYFYLFFSFQIFFTFLQCGIK
jgi:hypothetical protein